MREFAGAISPRSPQILRGRYGGTTPTTRQKQVDRLVGSGNATQHE